MWISFILITFNSHQAYSKAATSAERSINCLMPNTASAFNTHPLNSRTASGNHTGNTNNPDTSIPSCTENQETEQPVFQTGINNRHAGDRLKTVNTTTLESIGLMASLLGLLWLSWRIRKA